MRRVVLRFAGAVALIATILWIASSAARIDAQENAAKSRLKAASATASSFVIASGPQYANVRGLATDAAGGLYISLSATPAPQDCVSSAISVPQAADAKEAASDAAAKIPLTIFSNCALARRENPSGIAVTLHARVYLANRAQNSIRLLDMLTGKVVALPETKSGIAARNAAQSASSNLDPYEPAGLAIDSDENLYVADRGNSRVLALHPGAQNFTYIAHVLDAAAVAINSETTQTSSATKLYVASPASNRIFVIDLCTGGVDVFAGSGATVNSESARAPIDSNPTNVAISAPEGVAVDGAGNVFVADTGANALLRVDASTRKLERLALGANLNSPGALAIDREGNVFVADRGDARIVEFPRLASPQAAGSVTLSPSTFNFGAEPTGGTTAVQQFSLTNGSANALALSNQSFAFVPPTTGPGNPADFAQTNNCVPSVPAGGSCVINVTFTPSVKGPESATLQVTDADPSSPQPASLTGTGDTFNLTAASQVATVQNVAAGQTATYNLSVTPDSVFSGIVTLACPSTLSSKTQTIGCSINPTSVSVAPGQPQNFTVTFTTGGPKATRVLPFPRQTGPRNGPGTRLRILLLCACAFALAMLLICVWRAKQEQAGMRRTAHARSAAIVFAAIAAAAAAGCKYHAPPFNPNETPPGQYTIDISGSAQNASRSITLTLNVE